MKGALFHKKNQGFTLIEILVVIFIIAVMGVAAVMTFAGGSTSAHARHSVMQLQSLVSLAEQEAVLSQHQMGIVFYPRGYAFVRFDPSQKRWQPLTTNRVLGNTQGLPRDVELLITVEGHEVPLASATEIKPQLIVNPEGIQNAFALGVSHKGSLQYWLLGHPSGTTEIVNATR